MAINRVGPMPTFRPISDRLSEQKAPGLQPQEGPGFLDQLKGALGGVEAGLVDANRALTDLASGENVDMHGTMIALEKADIPLRMTVAARDKFIGAYEQIMNMSL